MFEDCNISQTFRWRYYMSWDIDVREKVYQRLANEIFFRILRIAEEVGE